MKIEILVTANPLSLSPLRLPDCGAVASFTGIVRPEEGGRPIEGLHYEAYQPMAEQTMEDILVHLHQSFAFSLARVHHRIGWVPVGEAAIVAEVHSPHRAEAFNVLQRFMDRLKQEVPIWKRSG